MNRTHDKTTAQRHLGRVIPRESSLYLAVKRIIDIIGAAFALVLVSPLMLIVTAAIRSESEGPIFFKQFRLGKNGKPFLMYKFRSMIASAPSMQNTLAARNQTTGPVFKMRTDPRVTRVGRIIRKYSIDELPQLFHVLTGHMTLVGPRPPVPSEVDMYQPWQTERLAVKPGLTCIWQVSGRSDIAFDEWVRLDIQYVRTRNLWLDLKLLLLTVPAVITGRGAY